MTSCITTCSFLTSNNLGWGSGSQLLEEEVDYISKQFDTPHP